MLHKALYSHHQENAVHAWPHSSGDHRAHDGGEKKSGFSQEAGFLLIDATDESGPHHQLPR
ncbi:hypothetical protein [Herbaspirillum aquaticum]|uniref:hypothetical protein n=1 Tax=Herbaspirillum aquaticum TaxID=568783 RepID=UPI0024DEEF36|nr:hypothetical protein [Herbaspirillum aquaticum]